MKDAIISTPPGTGREIAERVIYGAAVAAGVRGKELVPGPNGDYCLCDLNEHELAVFSDMMGKRIGYKLSVQDSPGI